MPEGFLGRVVDGRAEMLGHLSAGRYDEALQIGSPLLLQIDEQLAVNDANALALAGQEPWVGWPTNLPHRPRDLALLIQHIGLLGDCAFAAIGSDNERLAEIFLSRLYERNPAAPNYPVQYATGINVSVAIGNFYCTHGERTLDPGGSCMKKPPCE
jgi:hypothetical protein